MPNKIEIYLFLDHLKVFIQKVAALNQILLMKKYKKLTRNAIF